MTHNDNSVTGDGYWVVGTGNPPPTTLKLTKGRDGQPSLHTTLTKIAEINDRFRIAVLTQSQNNGKCVLTHGVSSLAPDTLRLVIQKIKVFDNFTPDNDPYCEHDFGAVEVAGIGKVFWKIDYYEDETLQLGAENPEKKAYRLLTLMLASEY